MNGAPDWTVYFYVDSRNPNLFRSGLLLWLLAYSWCGAEDFAVTGQWDFEHGDLRATVGVDLETLPETPAITTFQSMNLNGGEARVMGFGSNSINQGFYARHGIPPNGGGKFVNKYTLIMDVMYPAPSSGQWRALLQTDPFNHDGSGAEFFVGDSLSLPDPNGIGAGAQFDGSLAPDTWYRIAFCVDLTAPHGQQAMKYVNGVNAGSQSLSGGSDGPYSLGPAVLLFTAGTFAGGFTQPGFVNSIQFVDSPLSAEAIGALGGPSSDGLPPGPAAIRITGLIPGASAITLNWTGPDGQFQVQQTSSLPDDEWLDVGALTTNRNLNIPMIGAGAFYRIKQYVPDIQVEPLLNGEQSLPSKQILHPAGQEIQFPGRPLDIVLSSDGKTAYIKNSDSLLVVDTASWSVTQALPYPGDSCSTHGLALSRDGAELYLTGVGDKLHAAQVRTNGQVAFFRTIYLPSSSAPWGVAVSADKTQAFVCLSLSNALAVIDLTSGLLRRQIPVGVAPWDVVLSPDGATAYVSNLGGRFPNSGEMAGESAGTAVLVDSHGVVASGTVSIVDLAGGAEIAQVPTGLHPTALALSSNGITLYVANANSDTVTVIDLLNRTVKETIVLRPEPALPFGSTAQALALSKDGQRLFVAIPDMNAVAIVELAGTEHTSSLVRGFLPAGWYPGGLAADGNNVYVVNVKGLGSRLGQPLTSNWSVFAFLGTANKIPIPTADALSKYTARVYEGGRIREIKATQQPTESDRLPVPIPAHVGEPSLFRHVLYVIKENKTYDMVLGDVAEGNGNAALCIYPRFITPNHHALAQEYVLLDNFYCNGVRSVDGHSWATQAMTTDYFERSFAGFNRGYTFFGDALSYAASGFIWNNVLQHGLSFRNYGELDLPALVPPNATWLQIYADYTNHSDAVHFTQHISLSSLRPYSSTNVPGWNLNIPDVVRADGFIRELNAAQSNGTWAAFNVLYLPNDHTGGPPTPQAQVADNDLALGQVVEAVTGSIFASNTVIFVTEDDPQFGYDHVDGHRSLCLVISPYTRRHQVVSTFYNQAGVLHTIEQILGLPPMNQHDAMAPLMNDCFTTVPDFTPYTALSNNVPLAEGIYVPGPLTRRQSYWAKKLGKMDFSKPDSINEGTFNRYLWFTANGNAPYPAEFVGGHGKGLKKLGLKLDKKVKDDDD